MSRIPSRIEKISRFDLWKLATGIPPEWYQHDTPSGIAIGSNDFIGDVCRYAITDKFRKSSIKPISTMGRKVAGIMLRANITPHNIPETIFRVALYVRV